MYKSSQCVLPDSDFVDTDSDDYDTDLINPFKKPRMQPEVQLPPLTFEQHNKISDLYLTKVLSLLDESLPFLLQQIRKGAHTSCFTRSLVQFIYDFDFLRFFVHCTAKKLQSRFSFPRIQNDLGSTASLRLLNHASYRLSCSRYSKTIFEYPEEKRILGPQTLTELEVVIHHVENMPKEAIHLWTTFFRSAVTDSLVKRIEATVESGKVLDLKTFKGCGCQLTSTVAASYDAPLLYAEQHNGKQVVRIADKEHFPPEIVTELTMYGVCGKCFDEGLNEASNMFLQTNENSLKLASYLMLHSRTNHI